MADEAIPGSDPNRGETQDLLRELYEAAPCGFADTGPDGAITRVNETLLNWTGYSRAELDGRTLLDLLTRPSQIFHETHVRPLLHMQGFVNEIALNLITKSGDELPVLMNFVAARAARGSVGQCRAAIFKAESRRGYERELLSAKRRAEEISSQTSARLDMVSHDVRSLLNVMVGAVDFLAALELTEEQRQCVRILNSTTGTLMGLVNRLLDMSQLKRGALARQDEPLDLPHLVGELVAQLRGSAERQGLMLMVRLDALVPPLLMGDPLIIHQALSNLISNAIKFTPAGTVAVAVTVVGETSDAVDLEFQIRDTGIGIAAEQLDSIFDEFTQVSTDRRLRQGGTGLGLAITKRLLALHGASVQVRSAVGGGSTFSFVLRLDRPLV